VRERSARIAPAVVDADGLRPPALAAGGTCLAGRLEELPAQHEDVTPKRLIPYGIRTEAETLDMWTIDDARTYALSATLGCHLFTRRGDYLGDIVEWLVDFDAGQVRYAVVVPGGPFGVENRWLCVPIAQLRYDTTHDCFLMRTDHVPRSGPALDSAVRERVRRSIGARSSSVFDTPSAAPLRDGMATAE
jgi:hypothetical protein